MKNELTVMQALAMLSVVFQEKKISKEFYELYLNMLKDLPDKSVIDAIKKCLLDCKFFPSIAEIRSKANNDNDALLSEEFWNVIDDKADPSNDAIKRAFTSVGGIEALQGLKNDKLVYIQRQFIENAKKFIQNEDSTKIMIGDIYENTSKENPREIEKHQGQLT